jgi:hypothetical protein
MNKLTKYIATERFQKLNALVFVFCISILGISFLVLPRKKISINEKRTLAQLPVLSMNSLLNGNYMDSIDLFFSDHFPWREQFISVANAIAENRGFDDENIKYYTRNAQTDGPNKISEVLESEDSISTDSIDTDNNLSLTNLPFETIKSVVVSNNRAIQIFGGSKIGAKNYAGLINSYKKAFGTSVKVYCMPVPVGSDFYLPEKINKRKEKEFINDVFQQLQTDVVKVNAYEELSKHSNEYIQFKTDHHWTGRGAYYAYVAFCKSAAIEPLPLSGFQRKVIPNFLGTLYYYTLSKDLKKNIDSVEYFKVPVSTKTFYIKKGKSTEQPTQLYAEFAKGSNAYGVFLGGDYPLMRIATNIKNARKVLIFKDSYGNAFSPYLASHFEEVYIIDFRHFNGSVKSLVEKNNITDIVFAHNVYASNSSFTVKRELSMLNYVTPPKQAAQPLTNQDTSIALKKQN